MNSYRRSPPCFVAALLLWVGVQAVSPQRGSADSLVPYGTKVFAAEGDEFYVVVRPTRAGMQLNPAAGVPRAEYVLAQRVSASRPAPGSGERNSRQADIADEVVPGDSILGRGLLTQLPESVLVSGDGSYFVALDSWGHGGRESVLTVVRNAQETTELALGDLFLPTEQEQFIRTASSIRWLRGAWLRGAEALVAAWTGLVVACNVESGMVRRVDREDLVKWLLDETPAVKVLILDTLETKGIDAPTVTLRPLMLADQKMPVRLRAAVPLARAGDESAKRLLLQVAATPWTGDTPPPDVAFALGRVPLAFATPQESLALYSVTIKQHQEAAFGPVIDGLQRLLASSPAAVVGVMGDVRADPRYRLAAIFAVRNARSPEAFDALATVIASGDDYLVLPAVSAIVPLLEGAAARAPSLLGTHPALDTELVGWFTEVRTPGAIPHLIELLGDASRSATTRDAVVEALRFQTGKDFGSDASGWRRWYESRPR